MQISKEELEKIITYIPDDVLIENYNEFSSDSTKNKIYQTEMVKRLKLSSDTKSNLAKKLELFSKVDDAVFYSQLVEGCKGKINEFDMQEHDKLLNEKLKLKEKLNSVSDLQEVYKLTREYARYDYAIELIGNHLIETPALLEGANIDTLFGVYAYYNSAEVGNMIGLEVFKGSLGSDLDKILFFVGKPNVDLEYKNNILKLAYNINVVLYGAQYADTFEGRQDKATNYIDILMSQPDREMIRAANMLVPCIQKRCDSYGLYEPMEILGPLYAQDVNSTVNDFRMDILSITKAQLFGKSLSEVSDDNNLEYNRDYEIYLLNTMELLSYTEGAENISFVGNMIDELIAMGSKYVSEDFNGMCRGLFEGSRLSSEMETLLSDKSNKMKSESQAKK